MVKLKKPQIVNAIAEDKKKYNIREYYNHIITYKEHPVSMGWIMDLRRELIEWSKTCDTAMNPYRFIQEKGIPRQTAKDWCTKIPEFAEGFQIAKDFIALRREEKYIETNGSALAFMMPHYDEDYAAQHKWRAELKASSEGEVKANVTVIIPDMEKK